MQQQVIIETLQTNRERVGASPDEGAAWHTLVEAKSLEAFGHAWLTLACRTHGGLRRAALMLANADLVRFEPVAYWGVDPSSADGKAFMAALHPSIAVAIERRRPALEGISTDAAAGQAGEDAPADRTLISYPLIFAEVMQGVVLIEAAPQDTLSARRLIRHIEWSSGWIEAFLRRSAHDKNTSLGDKAAFLIQSVESVIAEQRYIDAARVFAGILAHRFGCARSAVSENRGKRMRLLAISQTAVFERKSHLSKAFEAAGDEAADQATALVAPATNRDGFVLAAQMALSKALGNACVLTVPLVARGEVTGTVSLVRDAPPFRQDEVDLVDALCAGVAPILRAKSETDRMLPLIAWDRLHGFFGKLFGPHHLGLKLGSLALLGAAIFLTFATDEYRVRARAEVQGEVRRVLPAPFDGYIKSQSARAGDVVDEGTVIAELQDNDLVLDRLRHLSRKRQYEFELDKALAKRDLAQINIAQAQIDQAAADIELSDQMLARAQVRIPFDSVVVNGDLSQSIGRPVSRGDVLFEIAPLDRYRVTLLVPDTDIRLIDVGQKGELLLSAFPDQSFPLEVRSITPVSRASDGVNGFEVLATLARHDERIRPAMEGVAKVEVGRRSIFWIWTHALVNWVRVKIWSFVP